MKPVKHELWWKYWNEGKYLQELGEEYDLSYERIRQYLSRWNLDQPSVKSSWWRIFGWSEELCDLIWTLNQGKVGFPIKGWDAGFLKEEASKVHYTRDLINRWGVSRATVNRIFEEVLGEKASHYTKGAPIFRGECKVCGEKIERRVSAIEDRGWWEGDGPGPFCSKECYGRWLGKNFGTGSSGG